MSGNAAGAGSYDLPVEPGIREGREALTHWAELLGEVTDRTGYP